MENNKNEYYIIDVEVKSRSVKIEVANFHKDYGSFYDRHIIRFRTNDRENTPNFQVGQKISWEGEKEVIYSDFADISISDQNIDYEISQVAETRKKRQEELKNKYSDSFGKYQTIPSTKSIIDDYFTQRKSKGQDINLYTVGIVDLLSEAMGLKVRRRSGGKMYDQLGFDYPEELQDVVGAMYDIISEYLAGLEDNETVMFNLCEFGKKGKEYDDFTEEIEKRTGYSHNSITSELEKQQHSERYHGENFGFSQRYASLMMQKPTIYISKKETTYAYDRSESNAGRKTITPELCAEKYNQYKSPLQQRKEQFDSEKSQEIALSKELENLQNRDGQVLGE